MSMYVHVHGLASTSFGAKSSNNRVSTEQKKISSNKKMYRRGGGVGEGGRERERERQLMGLQNCTQVGCLEITYRCTI